MSFAASIKHLALSVLPEPLLQHLRKIHYARKLSMFPQEPEMVIIPHLLPAGGCAIDLGANFGLYAHFLAQTVGPVGCVHAVEPVPGTFEVLSENVGRFGLNNIHIYPFAISEFAGTAQMAIPRYSRGGENLYEARILGDSAAPHHRVVDVRTQRLDDLFGVLGRIDFVKCDVEAHELFVLRGAYHILRVHRPAWLIEVSGNPDDPCSSAFEVVHLMKRSGYRAYSLEEGDTGPREAGNRSGNYFFLRPEHVRRLGVSLQS